MKKAFGVTATLIPGHGGVFDATVEGRLIYSKHSTGRFPEPGEIINQLM